MRKLTRGRSDSAVGKACVLNCQPQSDPCYWYGPLSQLGLIPECRVRSKPWQYLVWPPSLKTKVPCGLGGRKKT